jgi:hypothetical protein
VFFDRTAIRCKTDKERASMLRNEWRERGEKKERKSEEKRDKQRARGVIEYSKKGGPYRVAVAVDGLLIQTVDVSSFPQSVYRWDRGRKGENIAKTPKDG